MLCSLICILILGEKVIIFILMYRCTRLLYVIKVILGLHLQQRCDFTEMSRAEGVEIPPYPEKEPCHIDDGTESVSCRPEGRGSTLTSCSSSCLSESNGRGVQTMVGGDNCCVLILRSM